MNPVDNVTVSKSKQRNIIFDIYKVIAVALVYFGHFTSYYNCAWLDTFTNTFGLYGFTGKLGVAIFCVSLGFFAFKDGKLSEYIVRRYLYFFYAILFVNLLVVFSNHTTMNSSVISGCIMSAERLDDSIWPTAWCMIDLFLGSILCFLNKKAKATSFSIFLQIIGLLIFQYTWIAICLMGALVRSLYDSKMYLKIPSALKYLIFVMCFLVIQSPETTFMYIVDGIAVTVSLYLLLDLCSIHNSEKNNVFTLVVSVLGKNCMGFYLIHMFMYEKIGALLFSFISQNKVLNQFIVLIVVFVLTGIFSVPVNKLLLKLAEITEKILITAVSVFREIFQKKNVKENTDDGYNN